MPPSAFRVFGCVAFTKVPDAHRKKLNMKYFRGVFVGYPSKSLGCRIYNPATRRITTSVHVVFQEGVRGFGASVSPSHALDPEHVAVIIPTGTIPPNTQASHVIEQMKMKMKLVNTSTTKLYRPPSNGHRLLSRLGYLITTIGPGTL
jgi:hypothetical protein